MRVFKNIKGVKLIAKKAQDMLPYQIAVGQVIDRPDQTTREVKVVKMELNDYLKMYFNKSFKLFTVDERNESKIGDIVLIKKLKNPPTQTKLYEIEKILFQIDNLIDPMTGRTNTYNSNILKSHLDELSKKIQ